MNCLFKIIFMLLILEVHITKHINKFKFDKNIILSYIGSKMKSQINPLIKFYAKCGYRSTFLYLLVVSSLTFGLNIVHQKSFFTNQVTFEQKVEIVFKGLGGSLLSLLIFNGGCSFIVLDYTLNRIKNGYAKEILNSFELSNFHHCALILDIYKSNIIDTELRSLINLKYNEIPQTTLKFLETNSQILFVTTNFK
jgi:hypothetical protein